MGSCEPGQGRKSAAISSHLFVWRASHAGPRLFRALSSANKLYRRGKSRQDSSAAGDWTRISPMPDTSSQNLNENTAATSGRREEYVVVARRYRPQQFNELIGQEFVAKALATAIETNRVGHAYLFTGARGVGKTSAARVFAKALNCQKGTSPAPCDTCDICESIAVGEDVDVLEIDGASNRGIDEIRQLRENVHVRPSRSRFKIYIIDEVHMLTREAFNALLKTLEEPPEHVKFIFCTTEPTKIPVTILSRCQRYDFAGIETNSIADRLKQIVSSEGVTADDDALWLLARRAGGSMRDSQSLLEQMLAFGGERITLAGIHELLGTADDGRILDLFRCLLDGDAGRTLTELDQILAEGVDVGQLLDQLLGYFRDVLVSAAGCSGDALLFVPVDQQALILELGQKLEVSAVLATLQILEQTINRLRYSTHARTLAELAFVRICMLSELEELVAVSAEVRGKAGATLANEKNKAASQRGFPSAPDESGTTAKKNELPDQNGNPESSAPQSHELAAKADSTQLVTLTDDTANVVWQRTLGRLSGMLAEQASCYERLEVPSPQRLVVHFGPQYTFAKSYCERAEQWERLRSAFEEEVGAAAQLSIVVCGDGAMTQSVSERKSGRSPARQRTTELANHAMVRRAVELFDAEIVRFEPGADAQE